MKTTLRLPTNDQYAYIEIEAEVNSVDDAVVAYNDAMRLIKPQDGLPSKDFDKFLDKYLSENTGELEIYNQMSKDQQDRIQMLKRSFARIKARQTKGLSENEKDNLQASAEMPH